MSQVRILLGEPFDSFSSVLFSFPWGDWGIAKMVKARDFDSRIRWFESDYPSQYGSLAQLAEHLTFNQGVPGSNPG